MQNAPQTHSAPHDMNANNNTNTALEDDSLDASKFVWTKAADGTTLVNGNPLTRGKYYARFQQGTNLAIIDLDLHAHFPDSESVNAALRKQLALDNSQ
jgi:predicted component of type VI protein secretion system